jgi:hypothetical protein
MLGMPPPPYPPACWHYWPHPSFELTEDGVIIIHEITHRRDPAFGRDLARQNRHSHPGHLRGNEPTTSPFAVTAAEPGLLKGRWLPA